MSELLDYIGADDLVFNNDADLGIAAGGFSVNSIMMKSKMSPIMTINNNNNIEQIGGDFNKVSDLFNNLVVPNWALSYNNRIVGGKKYIHEESESDEDDNLDDDLHDKLLELVKEHNTMVKTKNKITRKHKNEGKIKTPKGKGTKKNKKTKKL